MIIIEAGERLVLRATPGGSNYQWFRNTVALADDERITGANTATLVIDPVLLEDTAAYNVTYEDGSKAVLTEAFLVGVIEAGGLPIANPMCLALLSVLCAVTATTALRRKKRKQEALK